MEKLAVKMIEHSGLGKTELAERLGVDRTSLWGWESGRRRMGGGELYKTHTDNQREGKRQLRRYNKLDN